MNKTTLLAALARGDTMCWFPETDSSDSEVRVIATSPSRGLQYWSFDGGDIRAGRTIAGDLGYRLLIRDETGETWGRQ